MRGQNVLTSMTLGSLWVTRSLACSRLARLSWLLNLLLLSLL